ncbi:MAG TPA: hypothetical protein VFW86_06375 [Candidatus Limnocylindrales bacterium]|nr:hypothetical protein [Candidatus Limnocylindrales bacterium]
MTGRPARSLREAACLALVTALAAACAGGAVNSGDPRVPTPPASLPYPIETLGPPPSVTPAPTVAGLPDPCDLLKPANLKSTLGIDVEAGRPGRDADYRHCIFTARPPEQATVDLYLGIRAQTAGNFFDPGQTIEPGVADGSQFALRPVESPAPGVDFGLFTLAGPIGVGIEYTILSAAPMDGTTPSESTPATADPDAVQAAVKQGLEQLATDVVGRLGTH